MNVADILAGGARLVRTRLKEVAIWGILYLVAIGVTMAVFAPMFQDMMAFQAQALAAQSVRAEPPLPPSGFFAAILAVNVVLLLVMAVIFAAATRAVALGGTDRFAFLRLGADEARLIGLAVLLVLIAIGLTFALVMAGTLLMIALAAVIGGGAIVVGILLYVGLIAASIWAQVRISLAGALTVLRGRIVIREAWRATRGRFWTLFGAYLVVAIVFFAVSLTFVALTNPDVLSLALPGMSPADMQAAVARQQAALADMFGPRWLAMALIGSVFNAVAIAFTFGAMATAAIGFDRADQVAE